MAQDKITAKQEEILEYIKETILKKGYPPAVREICEAVHLKSTSSVHSHLSTLEEKGFIRRDPTKPRTIEILDDTFNFNRREMTNVPVVGAVAAGQPLLAEQNIEDYFPIPVELKPCPLPFKGATPAGLYSAGSPARAAAQSPAACFLPIKSPASGRKPDHSQRCAQFPPVAGLFYSNTREPPDKPAACRVPCRLFVSYSSFTSTKVLPSRQIRSRS